MSDSSEPKKKAESVEEKFEPDVLIADATTLLRTPRYVAEVALAQRQKPMTLKEAQQAVERVRNSEVKEND